MLGEKLGVRRTILLFYDQLPPPKEPKDVLRSTFESKRKKNEEVGGIHYEKLSLHSSLNTRIIKEHKNHYEGHKLTKDLHTSEMSLLLTQSLIT